LSLRRKARGSEHAKEEGGFGATFSVPTRAREGRELDARGKNVDLMRRVVGKFRMWAYPHEFGYRPTGRKVYG